MPLWTPADLAVPPHAWWDVRDTATLTIVDGRVTMIADKSGNGRHLIGRRVAPEYLATGMPTGMPSARIGPNVYPDGTYGGYATDIGADFGLDGANFSAFAAFRQPYLESQGWYQTMGLQLANYANMVPWEYRGEVSRDTIHVMYWPEGAAAVRGFAQYDGWNAIGWAGGHGTEYVHADYYTDSVSFNSLISNGSAMLHHLNGTLRESVDIEAPIAITCVGYGEQVRHQYQPGVLGGTDVGEGVILAYQASLDERQRLEGYFAWGWGSVDRLPADHPYKTAAPQTEAEGITGNASATLAALSGASAGRLAITGTATRTLAGVARSSTARIRVRANASRTLAGVAGAATGASLITANASQQLQALTGSATGESQALTPITGNAAALLSDLTGSATGQIEQSQPDQPGWTGGGGGYTTEADERRRRTAIRDAIETARRQIVGEPLPSVAEASQPDEPIERIASVAEPIQYSALALLEGQGWAVSLSEIAHELEMLRAILIEQQQAEEDDEAAVLALLLAA